MSNIKPIIMPRWGLEMTEGTLSAWHVAVGDRVTTGQVIMDVESEKIANEVESEAEGVLRKIVVEAGDTVDIGTLLAVIADEQTPDEQIEAFVQSYRPVTFTGEEAAEAEPAQTPAASAPAASEPARATSTSTGAGRAQGRAEGEAHASPTARRLASRLGVDLSQVRGSGRGGRISADDVKAFAAAQDAGGAAGELPAEPTSPDAEGGFTVVKLTTMRKTIARRLVDSKQNVPHFYLTVELHMDALLEARAGLRSQGQDVSVNDCLLKACALALQDVPEANVQFHDDVLHRFEHSDVAFAVATDGGLITPVVRAAEGKSVAALAAEVRDLASRGRAGKLSAEEFQGGTLTLSNLGMYGIDAFSAVINPPQAAILAVGRAAERVVVREGQPAVGRVMTATLSCDHRAIDGALGARWLQALRERIERPRDWC